MTPGTEFDQFADDYQAILNQSVAASGEDSAYFAEYKAAYLVRLLAADRVGTVLDFGCGVGLLSGVLQHRIPRARVDGFDVSRDSIARVPPALAARGTFTSDPNTLAREYDLIVAANVFHHIRPAERQAIVRELAGRLASRGTLVIFEHNPANPVTRWVVERCPFDHDAILLPPSETCAYARAAGLRVLRRDYIVFMPRTLAWLRPMEPWLAWLPAGAQYAMSARKAS